MSELTKLEKLKLLLEDCDCVRASAYGVLGYNSTVVRLLGFVRSEVFREMYLEALDPSEVTGKAPVVHTSST